MFYFVAFAVFSIISFTISYAVVLQDILDYFFFPSFSTSTSSLHVLIFFLNAASSFILNLAVLAIIFLVAPSSFSVFQLISFLFSSSFILYCFYYFYYYYYYYYYHHHHHHAFTCYCFLLLFYFIS